MQFELILQLENIIIIKRGRDMSAHKHKEHLEKIKDAVTQTKELNEDQKSDSVKRIEEWYEEDKSFGLLKEELLEISEYFETLFAELGLSK